LEQLETRYCPAPTISGFTANTLTNHQVDLSGTVMDAPSPANIQVSFSGAASGATTTNSSGHFDFVTSNAVLGTVNAVATDSQDQSSNTAAATIADTAPTITLNVSYGSKATVTLSGKVTDIDDGGRTVTLTGVVNATVVTAGDGSFSITTQASGLGKVSASTVDLWGLKSNTAQVTISSTAPTISSFGGSQGPNNTWIFTGEVSDPSPAGLVITFGGIPELQGKTATVEADGSFSITVTLQPGETGTATAQTTDWWGLESNVATYYVNA
jgi:hypothetical protein